MGEKIATRCSHCGAGFHVKDEALGKRVKCPKCGEAFVVKDLSRESTPSSQVEKRQPSPRARRAAGGRRREGSRRRGRRKQAPAKGGKKGNKFLVLGLGGALVVALVLVRVVFLGGGAPAWFTQGMEKAAKASTPQARVEAYLDLAGRASKGDWGTAREDARKAYVLAWKAGTSLGASPESVLFLARTARKVSQGPWGAAEGKRWGRKALDLAGAIQDPLKRAQVFLALLKEVKGDKGASSWMPLDGPALLENAYQALRQTPLGGGKGGSSALGLLREIGEAAYGPGAEGLKKKCWEEILRRNPQDDQAHLALGHEKVPEDSPLKEFRGKWLTTPTEKRLYRHRLEDLKAKAAKAKAEADKWKRNRFARACKRLAREMTREIPDKKWHWFFDDEYVKKPYLLAVEESLSPTTKGIAKEEGQVLSALVTNFYKKYGKLLDLKVPKRPVGVFVFKSKSSYAEFQKKHSKSYPSPLGIGGFFSGERGRMYLWAKDDMQRGRKPMDLTSIMFHEGTHQLMHYNKQAPGPQIGNSPWLQEGIAEFFAGYYTRINPETGLHEYKNGKFLERRYEVIAPAAARYLQTKQVPPGIMPLKDLIYLGYPKFRQYMWGRNRNPFIVSMVYAEGWAFIHFLNHYEKAGKKGYYKDKFEQFLKAEIEGVSSPQKFEKIFGIKSDRDWKLLQDEFFRYLMDSDKGMRKYLWEARNRKPGYWPKGDEE